MGNRVRTLPVLLVVLGLCSLFKTGVSAVRGEMGWFYPETPRIAAMPARAKTEDTLPAHDRVVAVAAGESFSMALTRSGRVFAWGSNDHGQLGNGTTRDSAVAVAVGGLPASERIVAIAAGGVSAYALTKSGAVYAWGSDGFGDLGDGTTSDSATPVRVKGLPAHDPAIGLPPGGTLAVTRAGHIYFWGVPVQGAGGLAHGRTAARVRGLPANDPAIAAADGYDYDLALTRSGRVYAWGFNGFGALGTGDFQDTTVARAVPLQSAPMVAIAAVSGHSMAIDGHGSVYVWGFVLDGSSTGDPQQAYTTPYRMPGLPVDDPAVGIAAGAYHSVVVTRTGHLYAWGANDRGQLGNGARGSATPVPVLGAGTIGPVMAVSSGNGQNVAVTRAGRVYAWGFNDLGQLGDGSHNNSATAVLVRGLPAA